MGIQVGWRRQALFFHGRGHHAIPAPVPFFLVRGRTRADSRGVGGSGGWWRDEGGSGVLLIVIVSISTVIVTTATFSYCLSCSVSHSRPAWSY